MPAMVACWETALLGPVAYTASYCIQNLQATDGGLTAGGVVAGWIGVVGGVDRAGW